MFIKTIPLREKHRFFSLSGLTKGLVTPGSMAHDTESGVEQDGDQGREGAAFFDLGDEYVDG